MLDPTTTTGDLAGETAGEATTEDSRRELRRRWELASVLNFLSVFEPVIGKEVKMAAEEIEAGLIVPNAALAKLHVTLIKGIPPVEKNKLLASPDGWVTILCRKLAKWWPWVAEGEVPLTVRKGEEISRYKELDPTARLLMLKALCEVRIVQDDLASYINDALKQGTELSNFRKDKIGENGTGISYWYDGDSVIGHRLYREVNKSQSKPKHRGKGCSDQPPTNVEWETLATNLDEFRKVSEEWSSRTAGVEAAVYETIATEVIPVLEKVQRNKERTLKRKQTEEARLNGYHSYAAGITRTCRTRRPVMYTFDEYDRTIEEAIKLGKRKVGEVETYDRKHRGQQKRGSDTSDGDSQKDARHEEGSAASTDEDVGIDQQVEGSDNEDTNSIGKSVTTDYVKDSLSDGDSDGSDCDLENDKPNENYEKFLSQGQNDHVATGFQVKDSSDSSGHHYQESRNPGAKNRMRQRPTRNSAIESAVNSDSDNRSSSENMSDSVSSEGTPSEVADTDDDISS